MTIAIQTDDEGRIVTQYYGKQSGEAWTNLPDAKMPDPDPGDGEKAVLYYDETAREVTVEYVTEASG